MEKAFVVINEQHSLFPKQEEILNNVFNENWEFLKIPVNGWKLKKIRDRVLEELDTDNIFIFASPIPAFMKFSAYFNVNFLVFHNNERVSKEISDGKGGTKIIKSVSPTGWVLI